MLLQPPSCNRGKGRWGPQHQGQAWWALSPWPREPSLPASLCPPHLFLVGPGRPWTWAQIRLFIRRSSNRTIWCQMLGPGVEAGQG